MFKMYSRYSSFLSTHSYTCEIYTDTPREFISALRHKDLVTCQDIPIPMTEIENIREKEDLNSMSLLEDKFLELGKSMKYNCERKEVRGN